MLAFSYTMKASRLDRFLAFLDAQSPETFRQGCPEELFSKYRLTTDDLTPFLFFREETYGRNLVHRTDHCELLVLTWLPGQRTAIHDHGGSRCWMTVLLGTLSIKSFGPIGKGGTLPPALGPVETQGPKSSLYLDDDRGVHCITNASSKPAVSLHLYAGPVDRCQIYDEKAGRFRWMDLDYFTQQGLEVHSPPRATP